MTRPGKSVRHRRAGFTLLELVISFALLALALLLSAGLLRQALERLAHEGRRAQDPVADLAFRQLRWDVQAAAGFELDPFLGPLWSREGLILSGHPLGTVSYRKVGDELWREVRPLGGEPKRRTVLRGVSTWRWRAPAGGALVEVELGHRHSGRLSGGSERRSVAVEERRSITVACRGRGGGRW